MKSKKKTRKLTKTKPSWLNTRNAYQNFYKSRSICTSSQTKLVNYYIVKRKLWIQVSKWLYKKLQAKGETVVSMFFSFWWGYKESFRLYTDEQIRSQVYIGQPVSQDKILKEIYDEIYGKKPIETWRKKFAVRSIEELRHICIIYSVNKRDGEKTFEHIVAGVSSAWIWLNENKVENEMWEYETWHYYQPFYYLLSSETIDLETKIDIKDLLIFEEGK